MNPASATPSQHISSDYGGFRMLGSVMGAFQKAKSRRPVDGPSAKELQESRMTTLRADERKAEEQQRQAAKLSSM